MSVVIPVYNCKDYLQQAAISVLEQPYQAINIVLVDDGSTDGSSALCDALAQKHSRIHVIHQANRGVSAARNAGIEFVLQKYCGGLDRHYIAFLDADDIWAGNFFTDTSMQALPDVQIIRFQSLICNLTLRRCRRPTPLEEGVYAGGKGLIARSLSQHFGAALYACDLLNAHGIRFIEVLKYSEDVLFLRTCVVLADSVALLNKPLYYRRMNPLSAVHTRPFGIAHFEPMFSAYLAADSDGIGFVSWYMVDMINEHFQNFGTVSELKQWISEHEAYVEIAKKYGGERFSSVLVALEHNALIYALKNYIIGGISMMAKKIIRTRCVSVIAEHFRYPINLKSDSPHV